MSEPSQPQTVGAPAWPPARAAGWSGLRGWRADLRPAVLLVLGLALSGLPAGLVWVWLAPRADFTVTADGPQPVGEVSPELPVADDSIFVLVLLGLGLLAGVVAWYGLRRRRGVPVLVGLGLGVLAAGTVAWQLGEALGRGPTADQLAEVGRTVTTAVRLEALAALGAGPFLAVLVYLLATVFAADDELDRRDAPDPLGAAPGAWPAPGVPGQVAVDGVPSGRHSGGSGLDGPVS